MGRRPCHTRTTPDGLTLLTAVMRGPAEPTEFDLEMARLGLTGATEERLVASAALRAWVQRWYRMKYVPEKLLEKWGLEPAERGI